MNSYDSPTTKPIYRGTQIIGYVVGLVDVLLIARFLLKFFGANSAASFTAFIYRITGFLVAPFVRVFPQSHLEGAVFEWTTLLAIVVYGLIGYGIIKLFLIGRPISRGEAASKLDEQENILS